MKIVRYILGHILVVIALLCIGCFAFHARSEVVTVVAEKPFESASSLPIETTQDNEGKETKYCNRDCSSPINFNYLVVSKTIKSSKSAELEVFMDMKAFNRENLRDLFTYLSNENPDLFFFSIKLKTDWSQLRTLKCSGVGASRDATRSIFKENFEFHRAEFYRRGDNAYYFYTSQLGVEQMEKVVISGGEPPKQGWEVQ